ncbi:NADPH--cytochrome P450 reductase [Mycena kentingensis (nom. inval.)]|nr:NADPH--cytochrome P450 reductase [Mycena kentingensis (nom. inval.)]
MLPLRTTLGLGRRRLLRRTGLGAARNGYVTRPGAAEGEREPGSSSTASTAASSSSSNSEADASASSSSTSPPPSSEPNPNPDPNPNLNPETPPELASRLRKWSEDTAIAARTRADEFSATARTTLSQLGLQLNRITGYEEIEALKRRVVEQEIRINEAREAARAAKDAYDSAVGQRSSSQRETNDLLQRKPSWTQADVIRYTTLVTQEHSLLQEEAQARAGVHEAEVAFEGAFAELIRTILARYHEEQVWADKIRSASTYGSLAALALNLLVFVTAIVFVEPWKRRRLAATFEKKIEEMEKEYKGVVEKGMGELGRQIDAQSKLLLLAAAAAPTKVPATPVTTPSPQPTRPDGLPRRIWTKTRDPEVAGTIATSAIAAAVIGWVLQSWLG